MYLARAGALKSIRQTLSLVKAADKRTTKMEPAYPGVQPFCACRLPGW